MLTRTSGNATAFYIMNSLNFTRYTFAQLTTDQLYNMLALREKVFAIEQNSVYTDLDHYDQKCLHLYMTDGDILAGYARLVPPHIKFAEASIGRVVLDTPYRAKGLGKHIMQVGLKAIAEQFNNPAIRIEAQHYLEKFYQSFGFRTISDPYDWGGIAHVKMLAHAPREDTQASNVGQPKED